MSYFDLKNNYQSVFRNFLNPLLLFNRGQNGLINHNFNNNMLLLNDNYKYTFQQNQKANLPTIIYNDNLCLDEQATKWNILKENNILKPDIYTKDESNQNCFSLK